MTLKTQRQPLAVVTDKAGQWTGLVTLKDVIEEIIGRVSDEFEPASATPLAFLSPERVTLSLEAESIAEGVARTMNVGNGWQLPARVARSIAAGERVTSTYVGNGLAVAHGVSGALDEPVTFFGRSDGGIPFDGVERVHGLFVVLLPPRMQQAESETVDSVASVLESEYVRERLLQAEDPETIVETLREGVQVALD